MKAVYFHIAKTAGMTIAEALRLNPCRFIRRAKVFSQEGAVTFGHMDYLKLLRKGIISKEFHESAFKFTFVREPYDRAVSNYLWNRKKREIPSDIGFPEYTNKYLSITKRQHEYVDGVFLGFIGRFENLLEDIHKLGKILGVEIDNIPHRNKIQHKPSFSYYNKEAANNVLEFYRKDFDVFGYDHNLLYP